MKITASMKIFIVLICITAFFYNAIGNGYFMLLLCLVPVAFYITRLLPKFELNSSMAFIMFIIFAEISTSFSEIKDSSNKFLLIMVVLLIMRLVLEDNFGWQKFFSTVLFVITAISVAATVLSPIAPNMMLGLAKILYRGSDYEMYSELFYNESYAGLYGQTAINAYAISIFLSFAIVALFSNQKAKLNYVLLGAGVIALLLTKKRSFLFANAVASVVLFVQNSRGDKDKLKKLGRLLFLIAVIFLVVKYAPATRGIMEKFTALGESGDITNGREASWAETVEIWKQSPVFGIGTNTLIGRYGISSHNVYLQLLAEMGVLGMISYIFLLMTTFVRSRRIYQSVLTDDTLTGKETTIYGMSIYMQTIFIVYSFFGNPVYGINYILLYIVFGAVMDSYQKNQRRNRDENRNIDLS